MTKEEKIQLISIIDEYLMEVEKAKLLLEKYVEGSRKGTFAYKGKTVRYKFHGSGCLVSYQDYDVDFDYDFNDDGRYDGFDPWFLLQFWEYRRSKYPMLEDRDKLEGLLEEFVEEKMLIQNENFYYPNWS